MKTWGFKSAIFVLFGVFFSVEPIRGADPKDADPRAADQTPDHLITIDLSRNVGRFVVPTMDYIERYTTIHEDHAQHDRLGRFLDQTGDRRIRLVTPDEENKNNVYLEIDGKLHLLFSKNIQGFVAYESEIPVYLTIDSGTLEIFAVYVRLDATESFLKLVVSVETDGELFAVDPRNLVLDQKGIPFRVKDIFLHASLGEVKPLEMKVLQQKPCVPSIFL